MPGHGECGEAGGCAVGICRWSRGRHSVALDFATAFGRCVRDAVAERPEAKASGLLKEVGARGY